jgi:trans-aconitate 2-methyltransferase
MEAMAVTDWDPARYAAFRSLRLRPALDLLAQVPDLPAGEVVDLGCGDGAVAAALATRFPGRRLTGVDASPAMLDKARGYDATVLADIAAWQPAAVPALIFSNAALHWLGDHAMLMPRLARHLAPGGTLAVQMPANFRAPSHMLLHGIAARLFPDRFGPAPAPPVHPARSYRDLLAPLGRVTLWETEYLQDLPPAAEGHPVRRFTESTAMRPFLDRMTGPEAQAFTTSYDAALEAAYPRLPGGGALFPFRRLFFLLERPR